MDRHLELVFFVERLDKDLVDGRAQELLLELGVRFGMAPYPREVLSERLDPAER